MNDNLAKEKYIYCGCSYLMVNENISHIKNCLKTYKEKNYYYLSQMWIRFAKAGIQPKPY